MTYTKARWPYMDPPLREGDVLVDCTLFQHTPGTAICASIKDLTFINCNCVNVLPQATWTIESGNWSQTEYCTHDRPELIARGLKVCAADCKHRSAEQSWVDIAEKEYRALKASLEPSTPTVRVVDDKDTADVIVQTFQKEVYVYNPKLVKTASALLREVRAAAEVEAKQ